MNTPWGRAQSASTVAEGITVVSTASHGGVHLDEERNARIPAPFRTKDGWYEEDVEVHIPILFLADDFKEHLRREHGDPEQHVELARVALKHWKPDEYMKVFGVTLTPRESTKLAEREFHAEHRDDYIGIAAWGSWHEKVPDGMVGVAASRGGRRGSRDERYYLVPEGEYKARSRFGFVIDPDRHKPWNGP